MHTDGSTFIVTIGLVVNCIIYTIKSNAHLWNHSQTSHAGVQLIKISLDGKQKDTFAELVSVDCRFLATSFKVLMFSLFLNFQLRVRNCFRRFSACKELNKSFKLIRELIQTVLQTESIHNSDSFMNGASLMPQKKRDSVLGMNYAFLHMYCITFK